MQISALIDRSAAEEAVNMTLPLLDQARHNRTFGDSGFLHVVVMNPAISPALGADTSAFNDAILYEYSIGDPARWDADYAGFARAKAKVSWRTGLDSHAVQALQPHRLSPGDTLLWGGVCLDGLVVAASGAHAWYDEAFAGSVALFLRAIGKARADEARRKGLFVNPPGPVV